MKKIVLPDFVRRTKPRVPNQLLNLTAPGRGLCVQFSWDFSAGHSARACSLGQHTQLNIVIECISAAGVCTRVEKTLKTAVFNNLVVLGWEVQKNSAYGLACTDSRYVHGDVPTVLHPALKSIADKIAACLGRLSWYLFDLFP